MWKSTSELGHTGALNFDSTQELTAPGPERATWVGRIASASQASWLVGQSVGAYLNRFGDPRVPSACAVGLYVVCFVVASATLPTGHKTQKKTMKRQDTTSVLTASRAVAATAGARLAVAFAMRAAMVTRQVYELERWDLSRSDYASFGLFKSITGIAASWGLAGPLSRRFCQGCGTEHLVKGAAAVAVVAALAEAAPWPRSSLSYATTWIVRCLSHYGGLARAVITPPCAAALDRSVGLMCMCVVRRRPCRGQCGAATHERWPAWVSSAWCGVDL